MSKKKIIGAALAGMLLNAAVCSATVPDAQLALGGISYGASMDYVKSVYGQPTKIETKRHHDFYRGEIVEYEYGDSFEITFVDGLAREIETSGHNNIKTPAGAEIGMTVAALKALYGEPDAVRKDHYFYRSEGDPGLGLDIEIENGRVESIEIGRLR